MKQLKRISLLLAAVVLTTAVQAQVINGDLNHNQGLDVEDVTLLIDGYLTGESEQIQTGGAPFAVDNSFVTGTWYKSTTESITFNADGTTDYAAGYTYEFLATQGYILFYNASGVPVYALRVLKATSDYLVLLPTGSSTPDRYSATQPASITLSQTSLQLKSGDVVHLSATVVPADAGTVTWSSSDERVVTVESGYITAIADGTAVITAEVAGSTATCTVKVISSTLVEEITLSSTSLKLAVGSTHKLTATVSPSDATNKEVTWYSSDKTVATIRETGTITARNVGTTTIICSAADGSGVKAFCDVTVRPVSGTEYGHAWIDLGLSVRWATLNTVASSGSGISYAWGETSTKSIYTWATYMWCWNGSSSSLTKYCTNSSYGTVDNKTVLDLENDAAHINWGGTWRMPTYDELNELRKMCTWEWTAQGGMNGYKVTGPNGNSIFLPASGYSQEGSPQNEGKCGYYWSSSLNTSSPNYAYFLFFESGNIGMTYSAREIGYSVRAVCP